MAHVHDVSAWRLSRLQEQRNRAECCIPDARPALHKAMEVWQASNHAMNHAFAKLTSAPVGTATSTAVAPFDPYPDEYDRTAWEMLGHIAVIQQHLCLAPPGLILWHAASATLASSVPPVTRTWMSTAATPAGARAHAEKKRMTHYNITEVVIREGVLALAISADPDFEDEQEVLLCAGLYMDPVNTRRVMVYRQEDT